MLLVYERRRVSTAPTREVASRPRRCECWCCVVAEEDCEFDPSNHDEAYKRRPTTPRRHMRVPSGGVISMGAVLLAFSFQDARGYPRHRWTLASLVRRVPEMSEPEMKGTGWHAHWTRARTKIMV